MKILFLAHSYEPSNAISAVRTTSLARYLASRGDVVFVIARSIPNQSCESRQDDGPVITRVSGRACLFSRASSFLGGSRQRGDSATDWQAPIAHGKTLKGRVPDSVKILIKSFLVFPDSSRNWACAVRRLVINSHELRTADLILASGPPFSTFIAAACLSRRLGVPWIADYRDLWTNSSYYPYPAPRRALEKALERRTMRRVETVVTVSMPLANELSTLLGRPVNVVMNGHDADESSHKPRQRLNGSSLNLVYTGNLYLGKRDPRPLFDAIALLGPDGRRIRMHFAGPHGDYALAAAVAAGCPESFVDHGHVERSESLQLQMCADILLLLMWNNAGEAGVYTGKLFEYLYARRPILMLGWPDGVAADLIRVKGAGFISNDPAAIAAQLRRWLETLDSPKGIEPLPVSVAFGLSRRAQNEHFAGIIDLVVPT